MIRFIGPDSATGPVSCANELQGERSATSRCFPISGKNTSRCMGYNTQSGMYCDIHYGPKGIMVSAVHSDVRHWTPNGQPMILLPPDASPLTIGEAVLSSL